MGQQSQQSSTSPNLTSGESGLINQGVNQLSGAIGPGGAIPGWASIYNSMPGLDVPNMSAQEQQLLNSITGGIGGQGLDATQRGALGTYSSLAAGNTAGQQAEQQFLTGGPGNDPALKAQQDYLKSTILPQTQQQSALEGSGTSGASLEATGNAMQAADVPLLQANAQNQLSAASALSGQQATGAAGVAGMGAQGQAQLQAALQAAGLPREIAQQQAQSIYNQQEQKSGLATSLQGQPLSLIPSSIGQTSVSSAPKI